MTSPSRRSVFGSLLWLVFLVNLGRVLFAPLLEPLGEAFRADSATLGLVATLAWLGSALPRVPTGYLLTRVPRQRVVLAAGAVLTAGAAWTSTVTDVRGLFAGAFLMGIASGVYFVAANPLLSELFPDRVGTVLGVHGAAAQLAAVGAGPMVLLALTAGTWRTTVRGVAVAAVLATLAFYAVARRADLPSAGEADRDFLAAGRHQWRIVLVGVVVVGATGFVWNGVFNFYVTYLVGEGVATDRANLLLTVTFAAGLPAFPLAGRIADRVPVVPLLVVTGGGFVLAVLALVVARGVLAYAVVSALLGLTFYGVLPAADAYLLGSLPDRHRASAYALYSGSMTLLQATGAVTVGTLVDAGLGYDTVFTGLAGTLAVVLLTLSALHRADALPAGRHRASA